MSTKEFECDCGFKWLKGHSGRHGCEEGYRKQIAELRAALAAQYRELSNLVEMQPGGALYQPPAPVGYVFGNSYWEVGNPRLTDEIKRLGKARYGDPQAPSAPSAEDYSDMLREFFCCYAAGGYNDEGGLVPLDRCRSKLDWIVEDQRAHAISMTPSAPVAPDERAAFEKVAGTHSEFWFDVRRNPDDTYMSPVTRQAWGMWQARAALSVKADTRAVVIKGDEYLITFKPDDAVEVVWKGLYVAAPTPPTTGEA